MIINGYRIEIYQNLKLIETYEFSKKKYLLNEVVDIAKSITKNDNSEWKIIEIKYYKESRDESN